MGGISSKPACAGQRRSDCAHQPSPDTSAASSLGEELKPSAAAASACATNNNDRAVTKTNITLLDLDDDVLVEILSYLGSGRIEQGVAVSHSRSLGERISPARSASHQHPPQTNSSCLIHTIPFVNKRLGRLFDASDVLWKMILNRMIQSDPTGWEESVLALVEGRYHMPSITATSVQSIVNSSAFGDITSSPPWAIYGEDSPLWRFRVRFKGRKLSTLSGRAEELGHFVELLCQIVGCRLRIRKEREQKRTKLAKEENTCDEISDAKHVTIHLFLSRKLYTLPLLHIPTPSRSIRIGQMIRLDASDSRHRPTVSALTTRQKRKDLRCGLPLGQPLPRFVLRSSGSGVSVHSRVDAHLVELHRCHLQQSGRRADLFGVPVERVRVIEAEERDEDGGVVDASFQLNLSLSH